MHVKTQDLVQNGDDYWVRLKDLTTQGLSITSSWGPIVILPNVSHIATNGMLNTYHMLKDCYEFNSLSNAALKAVNTKYIHNEILYSGVLPSIAQLNAILVDKYEDVYETIPFLGYIPNYRNKDIWSSNQIGVDRSSAWTKTEWNYSNKGRLYNLLIIFQI